MMQAFQADILRIGNMAKSMNLAFNLLLWTAYNRYYSLDSRSLVRSPSDSMKGGLQQFQMTGDAKQVFDLKYQAIRVMSFAGFVFVFFFFLSAYKSLLFAYQYIHYSS